MQPASSPGQVGGVCAVLPCTLTSFSSPTGLPVCFVTNLVPAQGETGECRIKDTLEQDVQSQVVFQARKSQLCERVVICDFDAISICHMEYLLHVAEWILDTLETLGCCPYLKEFEN